MTLPFWFLWSISTSSSNALARYLMLAKILGNKNSMTILTSGQRPSKLKWIEPEIYRNSKGVVLVTNHPKKQCLCQLNSLQCSEIQTGLTKAWLIQYLPLHAALANYGNQTNRLKRLTLKSKSSWLAPRPKRNSGRYTRAIGNLKIREAIKMNKETLGLLICKLAQT